MFTIVEEHNSYVFVTTYSPRVPGEGAPSYTFDQCLHTVRVIGQCTDVFRGICLVGGRG